MGRIRYGVHKPLEDAADAIIKQSLAGVTSQAAKSDILTPWKLQDRMRREWLPPEGVPDPALRKGMFHRAYNPVQTHLNARDGVTSGRRGMQALQTFVDEHSDGGYVSWETE